MCLSCSVSSQVNASTISVPRYFVNLSKQSSVPADILYALAVKETNTRMNNRSVAPWPFTLNVKGIGYRYANYDDMMLAVNGFLGRGTKSIDIGLFQVNWYWHGHRVSSVEELGNPVKNGLVAAEILLEHYLKYGDWSIAAGRYHNPANISGRADSYAAEYRKILHSIQSGSYQKKLNAKHLNKQKATAVK